jgi:hypothetical protein
MMRSIIEARAPSHAASHNLSDAELLRRFEQLQEDLHWLLAQLNTRMLAVARRKPQRQRRKQAARNDSDDSSRHADGFEAPNHRSDEATSREGSQLTQD